MAKMSHAPSTRRTEAMIVAAAEAVEALAAASAAEAPLVVAEVEAAQAVPLVDVQLLAEAVEAVLVQAPALPVPMVIVRKRAAALAQTVALVAAPVTMTAEAPRSMTARSSPAASRPPLRPRTRRWMPFPFTSRPRAAPSVCSTPRALCLPVKIVIT